MDEAYESDYANEGTHPQLVAHVSAEEAVERLRRGNDEYRTACSNTGDISAALVSELADRGQAPFACVVACADSRVVPEHIFMTGLGELFCIRVAGNVMGPTQLASCIYAAEHLNVKLLLVLGHTHCGAIEAAMEAAADSTATEETTDHGAMSPLLGRIAHAIGSERDPLAASVLNVRAAMEAVKADPAIAHLAEHAGLQVRGGIYHTHTGAVDFLDA